MEDLPLNPATALLEAIQHERRMLLAYAYQKCGSTSLIERALDLAVQSHESQLRDGGEPYIVHPIRVAIHLLVFSPGVVSEDDVAAALLHDVLEDAQHITREQLAAEFSPEIADAVDLLSRKTAERKLSISEYYARVLAAPPNVRMIKLCDRLDNIMSLYTCPDAAKVQRYIEFTRKRYPELGSTHPRLLQVILAEVDRVAKLAG